MKKKLSGPGRPKNEIKTVAIGCRISEKAAGILDKVEGRKIGQFISKLIEDRLTKKEYASEKVKEALKLAAEKATAHTESRFPSVDYCECCPVVDKQSILALEYELLNQINKEI